MKPQFSVWCVCVRACVCVLACLCVCVKRMCVKNVAAWLDARPCWTGTIPPLGSTTYPLPNIKRLHIDNNLLTGTLPASLGNLSTLEYMPIYGCRLTGSIPSSFGRGGSFTLFCCFLFASCVTVWSKGTRMIFTSQPAVLREA